ncbi:MAG: bifunctional phosphopantothenoylcysteine decarboxylase/phosphopantothenate--cysteine ligase CoaBC [Eubacteriales bacterium]
MKRVILGVTASISAYKIANLCSMLVKLNYDVHVIMTKNATNFINPLIFETLTNNKCLVDTFDTNEEFPITHISLPQNADLMLIAPASANILGKIANGISDDMLTSCVTACTCKVLIAPAMNTHMYGNPITKDNVKKLERFGYAIIEPDTGMLACGEVGIGKLPAEEVLLDYILREISCDKDLVGEKILITAGPTRESLDPVRFITNHSSGKMGYELAKCAMLRGADVTLISGPTTIKKPPFVDVIDVTSARQMYEKVLEYYEDFDIIIKSAAVADYTPKHKSEQKMKKSDGELILELEKTSDILAYLGKNKKPHQFICGFSMETENMIENSRKKLEHKNVDMIVANNLTTKGAGFQGDTNVVTILTKEIVKELELMSKQEVSYKILDEIKEIQNNN